jgi:hypothetical protein
MIAGDPSTVYGLLFALFVRYMLYPGVVLSFLSPCFPC